MENKNMANLLEIHKEGLEALGFWQEMYKSTVIVSMEKIFKKEILAHWQIVDFIIKDRDNVLIKWEKKITP